MSNGDSNPRIPNKNLQLLQLDAIQRIKDGTFRNFDSGLIRDGEADEGRNRYG
jgi:hypothetical protein